MEIETDKINEPHKGVTAQKALFYTSVADLKIVKRVGWTEAITLWRNSKISPPGVSFSLPLSVSLPQAIVLRQLVLDFSLGNLLLQQRGYLSLTDDTSSCAFCALSHKVDTCNIFLWIKLLFPPFLIFTTAGFNQWSARSGLTQRIYFNKQFIEIVRSIGFLCGVCMFSHVVPPASSYHRKTCRRGELVSPKLSLGVNVSGCLSIRLSPHVSWDWLQPLPTLCDQSIVTHFTEPRALLWAWSGIMVWACRQYSALWFSSFSINFLEQQSISNTSSPLACMR